ncbi:hypothetical protein DITRI_Ditri03aG0111800 [Diplodiscus trichospermus]
METPGEWLNTALGELCQKMESIASWLSPLMPKNTLTIGQEAGKTVTEDEYLRRRSHSYLHISVSSNGAVPTSQLQAYVKPASGESSGTGTKKPYKTPEEAAGFCDHAEHKKNTIVLKGASGSRNIHKGNQGNSKKKKAGRVVSFAEAVRQPKGQWFSSRGTSLVPGSLV